MSTEQASIAWAVQQRLDSMRACPHTGPEGVWEATKESFDALTNPEIETVAWSMGELMADTIGRISRRKATREEAMSVFMVSIGALVEAGRLLGRREADELLADTFDQIVRMR